MLAGKDTKAPANQIRTVAAQMKPEAQPRLVEVPGADGSFTTGDPATLQPETIAAVAEPILEFVTALQSNSVSSCKVPLATSSGQGAVQLSESAAAGIAAQIAILDEDDTVIYEVEPFGVVTDAAAAAAVNGQQQQAAAQQLLQQHAQMQLQQALVAQQQLAAVVASKAGLHLQQAAAQRAAAAAGSAAAAGALQQSFGIQLSKIPGSAAAAGGGAVAPVMLPGMPAGILTGGFTPQMLAQAQAMAAAAANKQGIRPGGGAQLVVPAGAAVAPAQQQQQQQTSEGK
jgi:hypothetical protein